MTYISATLRRYIEERASYGCEYCLLGISLSFFPHEVDHIIAVKHGGTTDENNLAFACWRCNRYKATDLGSFDPQTSAFSFLFNPRTQNWPEHFTLDDDALIIGLTPEGRTTVNLLQLNSDERLAERRRSLSSS
ncbi:HNH endonuclease [Microcoleus sp. LEGE 07076]|uniref:HNH endonuclease n=1 Tax=Microcoleus sp. LEGE 07076 TaxID=915322 RepID=UPI0018806A2E|nr:HNH endonuclease [Microcoleus sp. LEGE 07076]